MALTQHVVQFLVRHFWSSLFGQQSTNRLMPRPPLFFPPFRPGCVFLLVPRQHPQLESQLLPHFVAHHHVQFILRQPVALLLHKQTSDVFAVGRVQHYVLPLLYTPSSPSSPSTTSLRLVLSVGLVGQRRFLLCVQQFPYLQHLG